MKKKRKSVISISNRKILISTTKTTCSQKFITFEYGLKDYSLWSEGKGFFLPFVKRIWLQLQLLSNFCVTKDLDFIPFWCTWCQVLLHQFLEVDEEWSIFKKIEQGAVLHKLTKTHFNFLQIPFLTYCKSKRSNKGLYCFLKLKN